MMKKKKKKKKKTPITLKCEIVSDIICPWCFLGHARLERALEICREQWNGSEDSARQQHLVVRKVWVPYLLLKRMHPDKVVLKRESYRKKYNGDTRKVEAMGRRMTRLFREEEAGVCYSLDGYMGSSLHAHRVAELAKSISSELQTKFVLECMQRYHELGRAPSDINNLQDVANICGLGISNVREWLDNGNKLDEVASALAETSHGFPMLSGVPHFRFSIPNADDKSTAVAVVAGAQDTPTFTLVLSNLFKKAGYPPLDYSKLAKQERPSRQSML